MRQQLVQYLARHDISPLSQDHKLEMAENCPSLDRMVRIAEHLAGLLDVSELPEWSFPCILEMTEPAKRKTLNAEVTELLLAKVQMQKHLPFCLSEWDAFVLISQPSRLVGVEVEKDMALAELCIYPAYRTRSMSVVVAIPMKALMQDGASLIESLSLCVEGNNDLLSVIDVSTSLKRYAKKRKIPIDSLLLDVQRLEKAGYCINNTDDIKGPLSVRTLMRENNRHFWFHYDREMNLILSFYSSLTAAWFKHRQVAIEFKLSVGALSEARLRSTLSTLRRQLKPHLLSIAEGRDLSSSATQKRHLESLSESPVVHDVIHLSASKSQIVKAINHAVTGAIPVMSKRLRLEAPRKLGRWVRWRKVPDGYRIQLVGTKGPILGDWKLTGDDAALEGRAERLAKRLNDKIADKSLDVSLSVISQEFNQGMPIREAPKDTFRIPLIISCRMDICLEEIPDLAARAHESRRARQQRKRFEKMVREQPYHEFMYRAERPRKVTCFIGPTNSGKSWQARQRVVDYAQSRRGPVTATFPLRLLALENQGWFRSAGVSASLITGEEQDSSPDDRMICQTIETLDLSQIYGVAMIDEAQLALSPSRGPAYLRALMGIDCESLILTAAPESRLALTEIFALFGEAVDFIDVDRLCPLVPMDTSIDLEGVRPGDLIVAFSAQGVHRIANEVSSLGYRVGLLYGHMPPLTRRMMMNAYQRGEIDVMVSTDAIGMGCNCPVRRVLFSETEKFDGRRVRTLRSDEMRQIAGRAGRYGQQEVGEYGLIHDQGRTVSMDELVAAVSEPGEPRSLSWLFVLPDRDVFSASDLSLSHTLSCWLSAIHHENSVPTYGYSPQSMRDLKTKTAILDEFLDNGQLDRDMAVALLFVVFDTRRSASLSLYKDWIAQVVQGQVISHGYSASSANSSRESLEQLAKEWAMYVQFQHVVPDLCPPASALALRQQEISESLFHLLHRQYLR